MGLGKGREGLRGYGEGRLRGGEGWGRMGRDGEGGDGEEGN